MTMKSWVFALTLFLAVAVAAGCSKQEVPVIKVKGSTTVDPITRKLATAYQARKKVTIQVDSAGSHYGLDALINGDCDIAESSSEASPQYIEKAARAGVVLKAFLIGQDHIRPIVHPSNPVEEISLQQLRDIYTGKTATWEPLTKQTDEILVVGRNEASGTADVWKEALGIGDDMTSKIKMQSSNSAVLATVADKKNALGYISGAFLNIEVKPLKIKEISSEMQTKNAPHPIYRNLYLYVDEKKFNENARAFIVFVLSSEGQNLIRQLGFSPVSGA